MEILIVCMVLVTASSLIIAYASLRGCVASAEESYEVRSRYEDLVNEITRHGYAKAYPNNDQDYLLWDIEWEKE